MITYVAGLNNRPLNLLLDRNIPLLHVRRPEIWIKQAKGDAGILSVSVGERERDLKLRSGKRGPIGAHESKEVRLIQEGLQAWILRREAFGYGDRLIRDIGDAIARAEGRLTVSENIPSQAQVRGEIIQILVVHRTTNRAAGKIQRRVRHQGGLRIVVRNDRLKLQRIPLVDGREVIPAQASSEC